ncbi:MAG: hypothetical protein IJK86_09815 [Lachnospiraceae bacterium]|nr:hypothetical protein [Lachnospiraceae bacterium]
MNKARKRFVFYAMLAVFVLLTALLGVINGTNYTMAAQDADDLTMALSRSQGRFRTNESGDPQDLTDPGTFVPGQSGEGRGQTGGNAGQFSDRPGQGSFDPGRSSEGQGQFPGDQGQFPGSQGQDPGGRSGQLPGQSGQNSGSQGQDRQSGQDQSRQQDPFSTQPGQSQSAQPGQSQSVQPGQLPGQPGGQGTLPFNPAGPDSPDMQGSLRYFTARFGSDGTGSLTVYRISAVSEEEALDWAASLTGESTGWTRGSYRYRVWQDGGATLVTVIDQSRELGPCRRILIISLCGLGLALLISFLFLHFIGRRLFAPLEEADRKQKQFITEAEKEFKVPLTVIDGAAELIEREHGPSDPAAAIHRQVRKMTGLVNDLGNLAIFEEEPAAPCDLSAVLEDLAALYRPRFAEKGMILNTDVAPEVTVTGSEELLRRIGTELLENALKFAGPQTDLTLTREGQRIRLTVANDALLPDGNYEQAFDRFTRLSNAEGVPGSGLGLAFVKEGVRTLRGRADARAEAGKFILQLSL